MPTISVEPLTRSAFSSFGEVIETANAKAVYSINEGTATRFHALARIDVADADGYPIISLFRAQPRKLPFSVSALERHPLGSQAFVPLRPTPYLIVVASDPTATPRAFLARDGQGINFFRGTWHHALLALERESDFLVVDRAGQAGNCDEVALGDSWVIECL